MIVQPVKVGEFAVGGGSQLLWICGPCVIESRDHCLGVAATLKQIADSLGLQLVFKASFDKANRTLGEVVPRRRAGRGSEDSRRGEAGHRPAGDDRHPRTRIRPPPAARGVRHPASAGVPGAADRPARSLRPDRAGREREEGAVHGPVGHEERRRQARGGREPARLCSPNAARRSATECWSTTCGRYRGCRKPARR